MNKKPILSKHPKKLIVFLLVCLITITLAGCDSSNKMPTDGIGDLNATYAEAGTYKVTVGDVFNKLRYNAVEYLENRIYNILYQEEINTLTADLFTDVEKKTENADSQYKERLVDEILEDIYGVSDEEDIEELTAKEKQVAIDTYVDAMYKKGYKISADDVKNQKFVEVYANYYLEVAKFIAAKAKLEAEFTKTEDGIDFGEITDESYFTKDEVVSYYENNYKNTGDVTAILIRFINESEAKEVLKKFGLKSSSGKWYQIKLDETCNTKNGYDKYYDDYKIDLSADSDLSSVDAYGNGLATVLKVYAAIYNYIYTFRNPIAISNTVSINDADGHLKYYNYVKAILNEDLEERRDYENGTGGLSSQEAYDKMLNVLAEHNATEGNEETTVMNSERLDKYSSSLKSYIYNTLKTEAPINEETGKKEAYTQYLTDARSYNNYYFLVFKAKQDSIKEELDAEGKENPLYETVKNDDDEDVINFTNPEFLNTILNEMFDDELTTTYINNAFDERCKEAKVVIYDSLIETQFMYTSSSVLAENYEKNKKENNSAIAEVTYKDNAPVKITVNEAYSYLEPLYGPQIASNLLFQQYIKETDYYKDLAGEKETYVETIKLMLYYFANDYYSSSGYPSTIGKYNFMMLYFGTANVDDAVDYLKVSDATSAYFADFTAHGFGSNNEFYSELRDYALDTYNEFYSLTASGLTVYVDRDEDGVADELNLVEGQEDSNELYKAAKELLEVALKDVKNSNVAYATAFENVVSEYNSSSRIEDNDNPTTPESKWAKYRNLGLHIKVSDYSTITNTTDGVDSKIVERVEAMYEEVVDPVLGFTSAQLDGQIFATEDNEVTTLLFTAGALPTSAVFETDDTELEELYKTIKVVINNNKVTLENMEYISKEITLDQVKVYVSEYVLFGDVYSLPSTTTAALDAYLLPFITKYTGSASQQKLVELELGTINFLYDGELSSQFNTAFETEYKTDGRAGFFATYKTKTQNAENNYDSNLASWWTDMYPTNTQGGNE